MSAFLDHAHRPTKDLAPGVRTRTFWGERMLLSLVDLDARSNVPSHTHEHEQAGVVVSGTLRMTIGDEERTLRAGDMYVIPGNVPHAAACDAEGATVLDVFSPVREEFKY